MRGALNYFFNILTAVPVAPWLYYQGKRLKEVMPNLPEANDTFGQVGRGRQRLRVGILGGSTMAGVGVESNHEGFAGYFANSLASKAHKLVEWQVYAKSGYNVSKIYNEIMPGIQDWNMDIWVIGVGANDIFELSLPYIWTRWNKRIITNLQEKSPYTSIFFLQLPPVELFPALTPLMKFFAKRQRNILRKELANIIDRHENVFFMNETGIFNSDKIGTDRNTYFSDGIHPNSYSYKLWAENACEYYFNSISKQASTS